MGRADNTVKAENHRKLVLSADDLTLNGFASRFGKELLKRAYVEMDNLNHQNLLPADRERLTRIINNCIRSRLLLELNNDDFGEEIDNLEMLYGAYNNG